MCELFGNVWFFYSMKSLLDLCKIRVDAELIYNLSILSTCDILHLLRSGWSSMALIQVSHPHIILFLLIIGLIDFGMYFLSDAYPIYTFPSTILALKKAPSEIGNIVSLCRSCTYIWSRWFCFFTTVPFFYNEYFTLGE